MLRRTSWFFLTAVLGYAASEIKFLNRSVASNGVEYRYVVAVPPDWTADRPWPIVLRCMTRKSAARMASPNRE